jgi:hypothetical protein
MIRNLNLVGGDRWRSPPPNRTARSLRTQVLPHASFRRPISGDCPCLVGVALPSGNGGCFMTSGYRQKLGQCAMPGTHEYHQWTGGIHFWHLMRMYIWLANHNRHKSIPTCVGPISLPKPAVTHITGQVSNYNAISQLISIPLFDLKIWSGNRTENRDPNGASFWVPKCGIGNE